MSLFEKYTPGGGTVSIGRVRGFHRADARSPSDPWIILIFSHLSRSVNHCKEKPNLLRIGRALSFRGWVRGFHEEKSRDRSQVCQKVTVISFFGCTTY